jgi:hypothetical protein
MIYENTNCRADFILAVSQEYMTPVFCKTRKLVIGLVFVFSFLLFFLNNVFSRFYIL